MKQVNYHLSISGHETITPSVNVIKSRLLLKHLNPNTLKEHIENYAHFLVGFEVWLSKKVGFEVRMFSVVQQKYFQTKVYEINYISEGTMYLGPVTYERMLEQII